MSYYKTHQYNMTPIWRYCRTNETGLSEVIGFVLILGILVLVFSLYLTYSIPAQGRENEIIHMNEIKDEFVTYKVGVDSLWTNRQPDTAMGTTFKLGTTGQMTQGSNSFIPIMQPVGSGGEIVINQRTTSPETITISSQSLVVNASRPPVVVDITGSSTPLVSDPSPPSGITIYVDTILASSSDLQKPYSVQINGIQGWNTYWMASINLTPRFTLVKEYSLVGDPPVLISSDNYVYNHTDMTLSITKGGAKTLDEYIVNANIGKARYSINILDDTYGLRQYVNASGIQFMETSTTPAIYSTANITYLYQDQYSEYASVPLGSLEYRTRNNYWIPQTYYYQMGGVFLSQQDGVSYKLPPAITFTPGSGGIINVSIIAIAYDTGIQQDIGGVSPVQIKTIMKSDSGDVPYAPVNPNTWNMSINITTHDEKTMVMWKEYLNESARSAWPDTYYDVDCITASSDYDCYIEIWGQNSLSDRNIDLKVKTVNLTARLQGLGGIY